MSGPSQAGLSVRQAYEAELAARGYTSDPAQLRAVDALQRCATEWAQYKEKRSNGLKKLINHPAIPRGVYMFGGVGRGKSFLMDCFFNAVPLRRKTRLHFHEFMREVHRELAQLQGTVNPLDVLGAQIAGVTDQLAFEQLPILLAFGALFWGMFATIGIAMSGSFDRTAPSMAITVSFIMFNYIIEVIGSFWDVVEPYHFLSLLKHFSPVDLLDGTINS